VPSKSNPLDYLEDEVIKMFNLGKKDAQRAINNRETILIGLEPIVFKDYYQMKQN